MANEEDKLGNINVEMGDRNSVGHIGHNITYQAPPKWSLTEVVRAQLLQNIPKDRTVRVQTVGSSGDQVVGSQVVAFLRANGYDVHHHSFGMLAPPPMTPLTWNPDNRILTVAPSAR